MNDRPQYSIRHRRFITVWNRERPGQITTVDTDSGTVTHVPYDDATDEQRADVQAQREVQEWSRKNPPAWLR